MRNSTIFAGGGELTIPNAFADPENTPALFASDYLRQDGEAGSLSIRFTVSTQAGASQTGPQKIAAQARLLQGLNEAVSRQCEPIAAAFGAKRQTNVVELNATS